MRVSAALEERCDLLRSLHIPGTPLILPNAWDAASAGAVAAAGFPVVATTSAGVASALGYGDHERAPAAEMLATAARMVKMVDVPVTVDAEAGYGMSAEELVEALLHIGAAGCNLEDTDHASGGLRDPGGQADRLAAVREAAKASGYGLVINARIDVFLAASATRSRGDLLEDAVSRAHVYRDAGADCVFPIVLADDDDIASFVERTHVPVNILAGPEAPPVARLAELGVARVSYGSSIHRSSMRHLASHLAELLSSKPTTE